MLTRLLFVGPPGVGKGTQAKRFSESLSVPHISTGDILRDAIKKGTPVGVRAKGFVESGGLVPDDVMIGIIEERFGRGDCGKGFILDGFPRTTPQAEALDAMLARLRVPIQAVVFLECPDEVVVERITGRRTCTDKACQATFHVKFMPPKAEGKCDRCGSALEQRPDDAPDAVKRRLEKYHRETAPIVPFYGSRSVLRRVPGAGTAEEVSREIRKVCGLT
jgi:adenylate kinase